MMIRVDMRRLGFTSVNNYAVGNTSRDKTTLQIPMFEKIQAAKRPGELAAIPLQMPEEPASEKWKDLYMDLQNLYGGKS